MQIDEYNFPEDLYYDEEHFYARVEHDIVTVGITDYAQNQAGEIIYVELPQTGKEVAQGQALTSMESGKWVGRIFAPVSGIVSQVNEALDEDATLINKDPYGEGWIYKIKAGYDLDKELQKLMGTDERLEAFIRAESEKHKK